MIRRLLIRPGAIGDFIVSLPALESLRADYTEVWCATQNVPLARFADAARSISSVGLDRLGILHAEDVIEKLRAFDSIVSWYGTKRSEFQELTHTLNLPFRFLPALPDGGTHAVEFYNNQTGFRASHYPAITVPSRARTFAVIHPFASAVSKRAPMEQFKAIAARVSQTMPVHWLRGPEEQLEDAIRIDDLYELACWLRGARVFVGNDSGVGHLAAAVGTPVLTLFQATEPKIWAPRGPAVWGVAAGFTVLR